MGYCLHQQETLSIVTCVQPPHIGVCSAHVLFLLLHLPDWHYAML